MIAGTVMLSYSVNAQDVTQDPLKHYRYTMGFESGDFIYKIVVDVNGDGRKDILLASTVHAEDGFTDASDLPWEIYLAGRDGNFTSVGEKTERGINYGVVTGFNKGRFWIGRIPELGKFGILHLVSGGGEKATCQLHAVVFEGTAFLDIPIGEAVESETHLNDLLKRFPVKGQPVIETLTP